jgi:putative ABC transport system ATP-binding protein
VGEGQGVLTVVAAICIVPRYMVAGQGAIALHDVRRIHRIDDGQALRALDGVSLEIAEGSAVALSGPSGAGKSTLLHLVGALDRPDQGTVTVGGRELGALSRRELAAHRRGVGFVFQAFNLLPALTVIDNVISPVLPYRVDFDKEARARELLAAVGLEGRETSLPSRLSGGQQQRVAIARALINAPPIVLADEPTGNLDSRTGAGIVDLLLELREQRGMTIVLATHDSQVAARCDRVVRLLDGRVADDVDVRAAVDVDATLRRLGRTAPG